MTASLTSDAPLATSGNAGSVAPITAAAAAPDVEIIGVTKRFGSVTAVDAMNLSIARGTFYSLLGPSGCGKTTTLRMIAGFEQPTEGEILLSGQPIAGVPPYQRNVNTVFQHYALFPHMNVAQNVGYGLRQRKIGKADEERRVTEALGLVRLAGYAKRRTWEMSGGQQQRVALARALVNRPTVLLLDEPLGALDLKLRKEMQLELKALQREVGITFVYVTHDQEEALTMSDVIVVMRDGLIQQQGDPTELYERPVNRFVADFIGTSNFIEATRRRAARRGAAGRGPQRQGPDPAGSDHRPGRVPEHGGHGHRCLPTRADGSRSVSGRRGAGANTTHVPGRIKQGTYLGDETEYRVETEQAGELIVRHQNATGAGGAPGVGPGDPVVVRWHEEANLILAG